MQVEKFFGLSATFTNGQNPAFPGINANTMRQHLEGISSAQNIDLSTNPGQKSYVGLNLHPECGAERYEFFAPPTTDLNVMAPKLDNLTAALPQDVFSGGYSMQVKFRVPANKAAVVEAIEQSLKDIPLIGGVKIDRLNITDLTPAGENPRLTLTLTTNKVGSYKDIRESETAIRNLTSRYQGDFLPDR